MTLVCFSGPRPYLDGPAEPKTILRIMLLRVGGYRSCSMSVGRTASTFRLGYASEVNSISRFRGGGSGSPTRSSAVGEEWRFRVTRWRRSTEYLGIIIGFFAFL